MLCKCFTHEEQKQLKLNDFNIKSLKQTVYHNSPENISFDENKLYEFYDKICIMDIKNLINLN